MRGNARCGHTEYDKGHCHQPGCENSIELCQNCQPSSFAPAISPRSRRDPDYDEWLYQ